MKPVKETRSIRLNFLLAPSDDARLKEVIEETGESAGEILRRGIALIHAQTFTKKPKK